MAARIKGQAFLGFLDTLQRLRGPEKHLEVFAAMPPDLRLALRSGEVLAMGWYSIEWYAAMHRAARVVCGDPVSRAIGRESTRDDVNSIYRYILKFFSPETLLKQSGRVFGLFCEGGATTIVSVGPGTARIRYSGCAGANRGMWDCIMGSTEMLVELCGGKNVVGRSIEGGGDDPGLVMQVNWT